MISQISGIENEVDKECLGDYETKTKKSKENWKNRINYIQT